MPKKNDISGLLKTGEGSQKAPILPATSEPRTEKPSAVEPASSPRRVGRPKKSKVEKRDFKITLSLTQREGEEILKKAGLADKATYLYDFLEKNGAFK